MSERTEVTHIEEVRGTDGSSAYRVQGGHGGKPADMIVTREVMHQLEKEGGRKAVTDFLHRALPGCVEGQRYPD